MSNVSTARARSAQAAGAAAGRFRLVMASLALLLAVTAVASLCLGRYSLTGTEVMAVLLPDGWLSVETNRMMENIVLNVRLPRVLLALIARALAAEPRILVLDEPESNLDFRNQMVVLNVIERLTEQGLGAVINTHFPAHALEISTKTLLVPRHRPPIFGDTRDVMTEDLLSDVFDVRVRIRELDFPERRYTCVAAVEPRHGGT